MTDEDDVVRLMDGYEFSENFVWISLSDELPFRVDLPRFKSALCDTTEPYPAFHLSAAPPVWKRLKFKASECVFEVEWSPRETEESMDIVPTEGGRSWIVQVAYRPEEMYDGKPLTRLTLHVNHSLCDGRTLGVMFTVVLHAVLDSIDSDDQRESLLKAAPALKSLPPLPQPCQLCAFGQTENFEMQLIPSDILKSVPESWKLAKTLDSLPKITMPDHYIGHYAVFPLSVWKRYADSVAATNGGVRPSLQGAFMAAESRAMRSYCKMANDEIILTEVVFDGRKAGYATPAMRERSFFCGAGSAFIGVQGKATWKEDIENCTSLLREKNRPLDAAVWTLQLASAVDPATKVFTSPEGFPSAYRENVVITTNIGRYDGTTSPRVGVRVTCAEQYCVCQYIWSTSTTIYVLFLHPKSLDKAYVQSHYDCTDELFSFLSTAIDTSC